MEWALITAAVFATLMLNIFIKQYDSKTEGCDLRLIWIFNLIWAVSAFVLSTVTAGFSYAMHTPTLMMSLLFAASYCVGVFFNVMAVQAGSLSLTALMISYSLIIPTIAGIAVLDERLKISGGAGIVLLLISLYLTNSPKKGNRIVLKWIIYVSLASLGNGICSTIQKIHQTIFPGEFGGEFLMSAMLMVSIICSMGVLISKKSANPVNIRRTVGYGIAAGLTNAISNMIIIMLSATVPASIMFPVICAGGIILTHGAALLIYKEKMTAKQNIGFILGICAVVMLNL